MAANVPGNSDRTISLSLSKDTMTLLAARKVGREKAKKPTVVAIIALMMKAKRSKACSMGGNCAAMAIVEMGAEAATVAVPLC